MPKLKASVRDRLMAKIDKASSGCWNWTAGKDSYGYGQMKVGGKKRLCHRLSFEEENGPIPDGQCVLHSCDNRACLNPDHLFLGTQPENIADMIAKGRDRKASQKGEAHGMAKLTEHEVIAIRSSRGFSQSELASMYGVSQSAISLIRLGKKWKHVKWTAEQVVGCDR